MPGLRTTCCEGDDIARHQAGMEPESTSKISEGDKHIGTVPSRGETCYYRQEVPAPSVEGSVVSKRHTSREQRLAALINVSVSGYTNARGKARHSENTSYKSKTRQQRQVGIQEQNDIQGGNHYPCGSR